MFLSQNFSEAAQIVVPWAKTGAKEDKGKMRFLELAPFLFTMSENTFQQWMLVYEKSREGNLILYNTCFQKDLLPREKDRTAWHISRRLFRDLQGCSDDDLRKLANYLLSNKKISLQKNKPSLKKTFKQVQEGNWISLNEYCVNKKHKKEFECILLRYLYKEKSGTEMKALKKSARKSRVKKMMEFFHLDKQKMRRLRDSVGERVLQKALNRSVSSKSLEGIIPESFWRLLESICASVDIHGNPKVIKTSDRMELRSRDQLKSPNFPENLVAGLENLAELIVFDSTLLVDIGPFGREFYGKFFKAVSVIGKRPSHVVVIISDPIEAYFAMRELGKIDGYVAVTTNYLKSQSSSTQKIKLHREDQKIAEVVTYAFYSKSFEASEDTENIRHSICSTFKAKGALLDFDEDVALPRDRSKLFYEHLCHLLIDDDKLAICFGEGRNLPECLLVSAIFSE